MRMPDAQVERTARAYAEQLGFAVFLVAGDCRTPIKAEGWFEHGVHDATRDPEEIARRFRAYPAANVAVACGPPSRVFVLDVDAKGDVDGYDSLDRMQRAHGALPATWTSRTPSGGEHRWFRQPERQLRNRVGLKGEQRDGGAYAYPGLDIRAAGGSAAAPPSRKPTGGYAWRIRPSSCSLADAPTWLLDLIDPPRPPPRPASPMRFNTIDRAARYVEAAVNDECRGLATMAANTGRNLRLFQAAANLGELVAGGLLPQDAAEDALERAADECGLLHEDGRQAIRATIASGMKRGLLRPRTLEVRL